MGLTEGKTAIPGAKYDYEVVETGHRVLLLIGNGFDCDLGLNSKYSDFVKSNFFKNNITHNFDSEELIVSNYDFNIFDYLYYKYNETELYEILNQTNERIKQIAEDYKSEEIFTQHLTKK